MSAVRTTNQEEYRLNHALNNFKKTRCVETTTEVGDSGHSGLHAARLVSVAEDCEPVSAEVEWRNGDPNYGVHKLNEANAATCGEWVPAVGNCRFVQESGQQASCIAACYKQSTAPAESFKRCSSALQLSAPAADILVEDAFERTASDNAQLEDKPWLKHKQLVYSQTVEDSWAIGPVAAVHEQWLKEQS